MSYSIYALVDPRDNTTRYVGLTNDLYERFTQHIRCDGSNPKKDAWIKELKAVGCMVRMETLEVVQTLEEAMQRETHWINVHNGSIALLNQKVPAGEVKQQTVYMPKELIRWLKIHAAETEQGISSIISKLVEEYKEQQENK